MAVSIPQFIVVTLTILVTGSVFAKDITRDDAAALMEECQRQREEHIAPLRNQAIEDCVNQGKERDYCERFNRTFGNARPRGKGTMIPGKFWDLPVCKDAAAAENYFRMNPSSRNFNLP